MKLKLTIAGKQHELTIEEAKALHAELSKVFCSPIVIEKEVPVPYPIFPAHQPFWERDYTPYIQPYQPIITCQSRS